MKTNKFGSRGLSLQAGYTTLEMLIAFAIFILSISAISVLAYSNQQMAVDTELNSEALNLAAANLENAENLLRENYNAADAGAEIFDAVDEGSIEYDTKITTYDLSQTTQLLESKVTWLGQNSRDLFVTLTSIITNPLLGEVLGGDTGDPLGGGPNGPSGVGSNPTNDSGNSNYCPIPSLVNDDSHRVDISAFSGSGGKVTGIDVFNKKAYLSIFPSNGAGGADFAIADVSDPANPQLIPGSTMELTNEKATAIEVAGNYAYVTVRNIDVFANPPTIPLNQTNSYLKIIDISNPASPSLVSSLKLSNSQNSADTEPTSIFYYNGKVYVGLLRNPTGPEFYSIDVSNPASAVELDGLEFGNTVLSVQVSGSKAYVGLGQVLANQDLAKIDITDPSDLQQDQIMDLAGANARVARGVYVLGNKLFTVTNSGNNPKKNFFIQDISGATLGSPLNGSGNGNLFSEPVTEVAASGILAFLGGGNAVVNSTKEFSIVNFADPANPILCPNALDLAYSVSGMDMESGYIYSSLNGTSDALRIIRLQ